MLNLPVHGPTRPDPLIRSLERHLHAENRSARTVTTHLIAVRQADAFLRCSGLKAATRGGLEAFLGDLLSRRKASTAATYHKVLKILYDWLAEEEEEEEEEEEDFDQLIPVRRLATRNGEHPGAREDLNLRPRLRTLTLCPLSYKGRAVVLVETAGATRRRRRCQRRSAG